MNARKLFILSFFLWISCLTSYPQDNRIVKSKDLCGSALAAIIAEGGRTSEIILAESLKNSDLPCAAAVMNALALIKSQLAVKEYIIWASGTDINIKAAAYNALAQCGSPLAYPVLLDAAKGVFYRWEHTGATTSLLNYAKVVGKNGDILTMDNICKLIIKKCNDNLTIQNKIIALDTYVSFHGIDAIGDLIKAASHPNPKYRNAALKMSLSIPGTEVVLRWINYFPNAIPAAKPEIIEMLGIRGDEMALSLVTASLTDQNPSVRIAASEAIIKINGDKSINSLINYLLVFNSDSDQEAAKSALRKVLSNDNMRFLIPVLKEGPPEAKISAIQLLAWSKDTRYFSEILPLASSEDEKIEAASVKALASLAGNGDQEKLMELLSVTDNQNYIADIQSALVVAASKTADPERRSSTILNALNGKVRKEKIIPVLAITGGKEALSFVFKEFENGNPEMRDICFKALTNWCDYSASSVLFSICASGNKTFEGPAFDGFVKQIKSAPLTDEEKLLLFRKIMPFALNANRKNYLLTETGKLKTYQSLYFTAQYLDDPETSPTAAKAVMLIALPSISCKAGMYGTLAKEILTRAMGKIAGREMTYDKEMINNYIAGMPSREGFKPMFNGKDLDGWKSLGENSVSRTENPINENFEMLIDWKLSAAGRGGIWLRGAPLVQIMDTSIVDAEGHVGSGGLFNNQKYPSIPLVVADNPVGDWNTFRIVKIDEKVSVWLNGKQVADNVMTENLTNLRNPNLSKGSIELKSNSKGLEFRDIYIRDISENEFNPTP